MEKYNSKIPGFMMSLITYRGEPDEKVDKLRDEDIPKMEAYFKEVLEGGKKYAGGDQPDMVDCFIYPFPSRLVLLENTVYHKLFEYLKIKENGPTFYAYIHRIREHELLKDVVAKHEFFNK